MSRQGGTSGSIGARGPGETKLETDRRHIKRRIAALEDELREMENDREVKRKKRVRSGIPCVAIAGYTNAGKSTLLNRLTDAGILAEDKLFATLDPTTRRYDLPGGTGILLTDTVGFIKNLPHHLIKAFKSTLTVIFHFTQFRGTLCRRTHHRNRRRRSGGGEKACGDGGNDK